MCAVLARVGSSAYDDGNIRQHVFAFCVQEKLLCAGKTGFTSEIGCQLPTAWYHFMEECNHVALKNGDHSFSATMDFHHRALLTRWIVMHCEKAQVELRDALQCVQEITAAVRR